MGTPPRLIEGVTRALTIAGSDSGGGAGIQADLKVFFAYGCHGMSALTALTAQNTVAVTEVHAVPPAFVAAQIDAVVDDIGVDAAKTGMLATAEIVRVVADRVLVHRIRNLVVDPVSVSKHRNRLLAPDAIASLKRDLFPLARVVTPNLFETGELLGREPESVAEMKEAARALAELGPATVLVKGGHLPGGSAVDVLYDGAAVVELEGPRYETEHTHGTGCALAAAIAARLAFGAGVAEAVGEAKRFVAGAIERALSIGNGFGPVNPGWKLGLPVTLLGDGNGSHLRRESDG